VTDGIKRLAVLLGCLGALAHLLFMAVVTTVFTDMDHTVSMWATVIAVTIACFLIPFGLVHGIAWVVRGFKRPSGKASSNQPMQPTPR